MFHYFLVLQYPGARICPSSSLLVAPLVDLGACISRMGYLLPGKYYNSHRSRHKVLYSTYRTILKSLLNSERTVQRSSFVSSNVLYAFTSLCTLPASSNGASISISISMAQPERYPDASQRLAKRAKKDQLNVCDCDGAFPLDQPVERARASL